MQKKNQINRNILLIYTEKIQINRNLQMYCSNMFFEMYL